jgi:hypothetical protein
MFRARLSGEPWPADVERLAWVPPAAIQALTYGVLPRDAGELGIEVLGPERDSEAVLFVGAAGAEYLLWRLGADEPPKIDARCGPL